MRGEVQHRRRHAADVDDVDRRAPGGRLGEPGDQRVEQPRRGQPAVAADRDAGAAAGRVGGDPRGERAAEVGDDGVAIEAEAAQGDVLDDEDVVVEVAADADGVARELGLLGDVGRGAEVGERGRGVGGVGEDADGVAVAADDEDGVVA